LEGGGGLGGGGVAEEIEAFDLGFDLAVRHKSSVVGAASYRPDRRAGRGPGESETRRQTLHR
jgi:hypothetical protein